MASTATTTTTATKTVDSTCKYCGLPMVDPLVCDKGHVFCTECSRILPMDKKSTPTCPADAKDTIVGAAVAATTAPVQLSCTIKDCKFVGNASALREHIVNYCPLELLSCPIDPTHSITITDMREHLTSVHNLKPPQILGWSHIAICGRRSDATQSHQFILISHAYPDHRHDPDAVLTAWCHSPEKLQFDNLAYMLVRQRFRGAKAFEFCEKCSDWWKPEASSPLQKEARKN